MERLKGQLIQEQIPKPLDINVYYNMTPHPLDNPVWFSLIEKHSEFMISYPNVQFYKPNYCAFGSWVNKSGLQHAINQYSTLRSTFFIVGENPELPQDQFEVKELICFQMLLEKRIQSKEEHFIQELHSDKENNDLFNLINLVQPGYFMEKTASLGQYYGIYKNSQLLAMAGERMQMNHYTELSAIVTHPDHTRKGMSTALIAYACDQIFDQNRLPFLHVSKDNLVAIQLYKKLGFKLRREISFWQIKTL